VLARCHSLDMIRLMRLHGQSPAVNAILLDEQSFVIEKFTDSAV
jgi:hypothetical protein